MDRTENEAAYTLSYLIEHAYGTSELWVRRVDDGDLSVFQPLKLVPLSGSGAETLQLEQVTESISLNEWMADHFEVFSEGRTAPD